MSTVIEPGPGDVHYTQYAVVDTFPIKSSTNVTKGRCYTMDADGYLTNLTAASASINNLNGIFQAMADSAAKSGESDGDRLVQCLCRRSRLCLKAPADVTPGDSVTIASTGSTVTPDTVKVSNTMVIGTVFEIVTLSERNRKAKTASGDLILVDAI